MGKVNINIISSAKALEIHGVDKDHVGIVGETTLIQMLSVMESTGNECSSISLYMVDDSVIEKAVRIMLQRGYSQERILGLLENIRVFDLYEDSASVARERRGSMFVKRKHITQITSREESTNEVSDTGYGLYRGSRDNSRPNGCFYASEKMAVNPHHVVLGESRGASKVSSNHTVLDFDVERYLSNTHHGDAYHYVPDLNYDKLLYLLGDLLMKE